jgi:hypothetical protein
MGRGGGEVGVQDLRATCAGHPPCRVSGLDPEPTRIRRGATASASGPRITSGVAAVELADVSGWRRFIWLEHNFTKLACAFAEYLNTKTISLSGNLH